MVRVVAGVAGGLKLNTPDSEDTKPTLDRVKEPMFSMLTPYIPGRTVLDLFAGSGALGIEALSRGAEFCYFNDVDRRCREIVRQNLEHTRLLEKAEVLSAPYRQALSLLKKRGVKLGLVLLDPPYKMNCYEEVILTGLKYRLFDEECVIMCEHGREVVLPEEIGGFHMIKDRSYGTVGVSIFSGKTGGEEADALV